MILRKLLKAIKVAENSSQISGHFKTKERLKKEKKLQIRTRDIGPCALGCYTMRPGTDPEISESGVKLVICKYLYKNI